jgi:hypothetical protein
MISLTKCCCGCRSFFNFSYRSWHLLADSAGLRWAKFPVAIRNLPSRRHSPSRSYGPQFCFPNDLSLKGESRSNPGWCRKILRTRRRSPLNTAIKFLYENEQFSGDSGDPIVDLRFERLCGASAALSQQSVPSRSHHHNRGGET